MSLPIKSWIQKYSPSIKYFYILFVGNVGINVVTGISIYCDENLRAGSTSFEDKLSNSRSVKSTAVAAV